MKYSSYKIIINKGGGRKSSEVMKKSATLAVEWGAHYTEGAGSTGVASGRPAMKEQED